LQPPFLGRCVIRTLGLFIDEGLFLLFHVRFVFVSEEHTVKRLVSGYDHLVVKTLEEDQAVDLVGLNWLLFVLLNLRLTLSHQIKNYKSETNTPF